MRKVAPQPASLSTSIDPPCASTIAFAMDNPRPVPPFRLDRSGPIFENRSKILGMSSAQMPLPRSAISSTRTSRPPRQPALIALPSSVAFTAFSINASGAVSRRSRSARIVPSAVTRTCHARSAVAPSAHEPDNKRLDLDLGGGEEARILRGRQDHQALGELREAAELVEDDAGILGDLPVYARVADQLGVAAGDRDRRPQLVRGVANECALALD
jgi:hypothetical protein